MSVCVCVRVCVVLTCVDEGLAPALHVQHQSQDPQVAAPGHDGRPQRAEETRHKAERLHVQRFPAVNTCWT